MILTKDKIDSVDLDLLIERKIKDEKLAGLLLIVPTNRKIRTVKREIISSSPDNAAPKLNLETIGTFSTNLLFASGDSKAGVLTEAAASVLLKQSFNEVKLKYFSSYNNEIPSGTLERIRNVISEYKKHGVTPANLISESGLLQGSEKIKAEDIANIFSVYQQKCSRLNVKETGDIYDSVNKLTGTEFGLCFRKLYPEVNLIVVNGFDEFTTPEIEIIDKASNLNDCRFFISFDYFSYNPAVFSHLDKCYEKFLQKGFVETGDKSISIQNKFQTAVKENIFRSTAGQTKAFENQITVIKALTREKEIEVIAKEIKDLIIDKKIEPHKICVVFNLIQNYSSVIRDIFRLYNLPFNLTDRYALKTSSPVISIINFLEILENDFYYKNIFRAISSGILSFAEIDQSVLMKAAFNLKIISGFENWKNSLHDAIRKHGNRDEEESSSLLGKEIYEKALEDIQLLHAHLLPFGKHLSISEFKNNLMELIYSVDIPGKLINNPAGSATEENIKAVTTFLEESGEVFELLGMEYKPDQKFQLTFFLNNLRTIISSTRYNIKEKPGYGVQVTTLNEIRGLQFDYLFISGLCDGDLPTRYTPEIFFSGSYSRSERIHQTEERYQFYQSLCSWRKHLYLTFPVQEERKELVSSNFLTEFKKNFAVQSKDENDYKDFLYSKEELLIHAGNLGIEKTKQFYPGENELNYDQLEKALAVNDVRMHSPFGQSQFTGFIKDNLSDETKENLEGYKQKEYSISQLETYAKCPYKYFAERILKLKPLQEPTEDVEALEMGSLLHSILYKFYSEIRKRNIILSDASEKEFDEAVKLIFEIAGELIAGVNFSSPLTFYEKEKILGIEGRKENSILYKFLEEERNNKDGFVPKFFETSFGGSSEEKDKLFLKAGSVDVTGKIDRIDIKDKTGKYKVVDYKSGANKVSLRNMNRGLDLQLPLYMFAAKELIKAQIAKDYQPAGAEIYSLKFNSKDFGKTLVTQTVRSKMSDEEKEELASESNRALIAECINVIEKYVHDIAEGKFNLSTLKDREKIVCSMCNFKPVCRIQEAG